MKRLREAKAREVPWLPLLTHWPSPCLRFLFHFSNDGSLSGLHICGEEDRGVIYRKVPRKMYIYKWKMISLSIFLVFAFQWKASLLPWQGLEDWRVTLFVPSQSLILPICPCFLSLTSLRCEDVMERNADHSEGSQPCHFSAGWLRTGDRSFQPQFLICTAELKVTPQGPGEVVDVVHGRATGI